MVALAYGKSGGFMYGKKFAGHGSQSGLELKALLRTLDFSRASVFLGFFMLLWIISGKFKFTLYFFNYSLMLKFWLNSQHREYFHWICRKVIPLLFGIKPTRWTAIIMWLRKRIIAKLILEMRKLYPL